jgi:hypothetical protein
MVCCMAGCMQEDSSKLKGNSTTAQKSTHWTKNSATIRILLMLVVMADMLAHVVDVKGAFLHGEFEDGEIIHMRL